MTFLTSKAFDFNVFDKGFEGPYLSSIYNFLTTFSMSDRFEIFNSNYFKIDVSDYCYLRT